MFQRSEALGVCLAAFSTALPYLGKFLKVGDLVCLQHWLLLACLELFVGDECKVFDSILERCLDMMGLFVGEVEYALCNYNNNS